MRTPRFFIPLLLLAASHVWADSVTLKTGEQITGTIKNETDTEVTIDVQVSASINDERTIEKTDIAKIDKAQPDDIAYNQLIQVQPNPQFSLTPDQYSQIITSLKAFENQYPASSHLADIRKLDASFEGEKQHVDSGQYKYLGQWISQEEAAKRRIQIEAADLYASMAQQASAGDYIGAMQTFSAIEKSYKTTRVYPSAVTLANQILAQFIPTLASYMQRAKSNDAQMKQTIAMTPVADRATVIQQSKARQDQAAAAVAQALKAGMKWVPLIPDSQVSVSTLQKAATAEAAALRTVPVAAMEQSIAKVDAAHASLAARDFTGANMALQQAVALWSQNEDAHYTLVQLKEALSTPTPKPTPKPTPRPSATETQQMVSIVTPAPSPGDEAPKPFLMTVPGALSVVGGLVVLAGIAAIFGKRKKSDVEE